jgi:hypothetical protein
LTDLLRYTDPLWGNAPLDALHTGMMVLLPPFEPPIVGDDVFHFKGKLVNEVAIPEWTFSDVPHDPAADHNISLVFPRQFELSMAVDLAIKFTNFVSARATLLLRGQVRCPVICYCYLSPTVTTSRRGLTNFTVPYFDTGCVCMQPNRIPMTSQNPYVSSLGRPDVYSLSLNAHTQSDIALRKLVTRNAACVIYCSMDCL